MQIIELLEPHRRGIYCGTIGYVGFDGNMDSNIVIRTLVYSGCDTLLAKPADCGNSRAFDVSSPADSLSIIGERSGIIRCWAGGGIVADSEEKSEYQETLDKASAMLELLRHYGGKYDRPAQSR
jgi:para-aminobenzoate synthetase component 1